MIPFILGALAAVGLSELSKRNKPKMADGAYFDEYYYVFVKDADSDKDEVIEVLSDSPYYAKEEAKKMSKFKNPIVINLIKESEMAKGGGVGKYSKIDLVVKKPYGNEHFEVAKFKKTGDAIISANALGEKAPRNYEYYVKSTKKYAKGGLLGDYEVVGILRFVDLPELKVWETIIANNENQAIEKIKKRYIGVAPDSDLTAKLIESYE
jgi:hypothetical protein